MPAVIAKHRKYEHDRDKDAVIRLCQGVYGGEDYLPHRLNAIAGDSRCFPIVLENQYCDILAFANMRAMHGKQRQADCLPVPLFLEAVRVSPRAYGNGHGRAVVGGAIGVLRIGECGNSSSKLASIVSVTIPSNLAMLRIFRSLGFKNCGAGRLHIWPSYPTFSAISDEEAPLLDMLGIDSSIPTGAIEQLDAWHPINDGDTVWTAVAQMDLSAAASGFIPGYYALETIENVCEAVDDQQATVWKLEDDTGVIVLQKNASVSIEAHQTIVSVLAVSVEAAEAAVAFADRRLCLTRFRAVFDANLSEKQLQRSAFLGSAGLTPFDAFILQNEMNRE
jgi:hypothetical protein